MKTETQKFVPRPASPDETMLFFDISEAWNAALGAIGFQYVQLEGGGDPPAVWHPRGAEELRTTEFKAEMDALLDELRKNGPLKSADDLRQYCREHGGEINSSLCEQGHGYIVDTEKYRYCLLCDLKSGDPQVYLHAYDRQVLEQYEKQSFHKEDMREFIAGLLGGVDPAAMEAWISYASALQREGTEMTANFYRDLCGELEYIKDRAGEEIARQLFDEGREFTLNPFELRSTALLLVAGTSMEEITRMSVEEDLFSPMQRDSGSFPQPMDGSESQSPVGRVSRADGEPREYTDALEYVTAVKRELHSDGAAGLRCETLTDDPLVRKAVDDIIGEYVNITGPRESGMAMKLVGP